jgi:hypothetical protein
VWPDLAGFRHLGYFVLDQFSPKGAVSTHGGISRFKKMFEVDVLAFQIQLWCWHFWFLDTFTKIRRHSVQLSSHTGYIYSNFGGFIIKKDLDMWRAACSIGSIGSIGNIGSKKHWCYAAAYTISNCLHDT